MMNRVNCFISGKDKLTVHCGVLMLGQRVVIPVKLRDQVLTELHEGHLGIVKMKSLTRSYIWWPKAALVANSNRMTGKALVHSWEWPATPWQRIHEDFAGTFLGRTFLIIIDAHSSSLKWKSCRPPHQHRLSTDSEPFLLGMECQHR